MSSHHSLGTVYCRNNGDCTIHIAIYESSFGKVLLSQPTAESVVIRQVASMFGRVVTLQWDIFGTYSAWLLLLLTDSEGHAVNIENHGGQ